MVDSKYDSSPIALVRNSLFVVRFLCRSIGRPTSKFVGLCFLCFIYALLLLLGHQSFLKNAEKISWICLIVGLAESFIALPVIALRSIPYEIDTIILRDFPFSVFLALFMFVIYLLLLVRKIKMRTKITG